MARKEARIFTGVWSEPQWRSLTAGEQWMYLFLISQPDIAHDGVISLRPRRWASNADGLTAKDVMVWLDGLEAANYAVVDQVTEEVLVRSFMRHDQVYLQPNLMASAVAHLPGVESTRIRRALYAEITRVVRENGDRARQSAGLPPLTEKQKVPIRQMVAILRASGDDSRALEAGSDPAIRPVEIPPQTGSAAPDRPGSPNPSPNPSDRPTSGPDDLRSNGPDDLRSLPDDLRSFSVDLRSVTQNGDPNSGSFRPKINGHSGNPIDPLPPGETNPSPNPSPNPLGDRGKVRTVTGDTPYPLSPIPYLLTTNGHDLRSTSRSEDRLFDDPVGGDDPVMADFGPSEEPERRRAGAETAFGRFWDVYPLKVKKGYARQCWDRAVKRATPERIIRGARRYAEDPNRSDAYTAHPSSWLNQDRWDDAPLPPRPEQVRRGERRTSAHLDVVAKLRAERAPDRREITDGG